VPFGENVEGLSHCVDDSFAFEPAVQKYDFQDSSLRRVISSKPLPPKCLRKFKSFLRQLSRFVVGAGHHVQSQLDRGEPIPHLRVFPGEPLLVDVLGCP
jgi:hypothetical protein